MKPIFRFLLIVVVLCNNYSLSYAQCNGFSLAHDSLHFSFVGYNPPPTLTVSDGNISMARHNDTIYFGGSFSWVGKNTGKFARLKESNSELVNHYTWPRANGDVYASAPDGNGGWIISGSFTKVGDSDRYHLAHITASGQVGKLSITMLPKTQFTYPKAMVVVGDTLFIGGNFYQINGQTRNALAAFSLTTGNLSSTWNPGANGDVLGLGSDGTNIYVGGTFSTLGSSSRVRVGSISASTGNVTTWNPVIVGFNVRKFIFNGNDVIFGGRFQSVGGQTRNNLAMVNKNTGALGSFNPNVNYWSADPVVDMTLLNGKLYIAGNFDKVSNIPRARVASIDLGTGNVTSWNPNPSAVNALTVNSIASTDSSIVIGGRFSRINNVYRPGVAVLDTGAIATLKDFDAGLDSYSNYISTVEAHGGNIYFGGELYGIKGELRSGLAAIDIKNNKLLPNFKPEVIMSASYGYQVDALTVDNGILYIGGKFDKVNGVARNYAASFNIANNYALTTWNPLNVSGSFTDVTVIKTNGNYAYIGGDFDFVYNGNHDAIVRVNKTSGVIDTWTPATYTGSYRRVMDIAFADNRVYFGGALQNASFNFAGMQYYDFSNSSNYFYSFSSDVTKILPLNNKLYLAGVFTTVNSTSRNIYAVIDRATNQPTSWNANTPAYTYWHPGIFSYKDKVLMVGDSIVTNGDVTFEVNLRDTVSAALSPGWLPITNGNIRDVLTMGDTLFITGGFRDVDMGSPSVRNLYCFARFDMGNYTSASVSITTIKDTVCAGATAMAVASTTVSNATYQWRINDTVQTGNNDTFTFIPDDNDTLKCIITVPSGGCSLDTSATSNEIIYEVLPNTTVTNSLSVNADTVCIGDTVHFTTNTNISNVSYQWKVGTTNVGAGVDTYSYVPSNGDVVSCTFKALAGCYSPDSSVIDTAISVHADTIASVTITAATNPFCPGDNDTLTATANVTPAAYQWRVNGSNVGGPTINSFVFTPANNDVVECIVNATGLGCYEPDHDTSNVITLTAITPDTAKISITASSNPVPCTSILDTFTATTAVTNPTYAWKINGSPAGSNNSVYSYMPVNNDVVTCDVIAPASACFVKDTIASNSITVGVTQPPSITTQPSDVGLSDGKTAQFVVAASGTGLSYQWQVNTGSGFVNVVDGGQYSGAQTNTLTVSNVSATNNTNRFRCIVVAGTCPQTSNEAQLTVFPVGISNPVAENISVYPNPASHTVTITADIVMKNIEIVNFLGQEVYRKTADNKQLTIDMQHFAPGIYMLMINDKYLYRLVKN